MKRLKILLWYKQCVFLSFSPKFPLLYLLRRVFSLRAFLFLTLVFSCDIKLNNIGEDDNL